MTPTVRPSHPVAPISNALDFSSLQPAEIKKHLDEYIIGQDQAKKAVAVAMRMSIDTRTRHTSNVVLGNRWRRKHVPEELRKEIVPKNILMMGPTGVGKTEVARRYYTLFAATDHGHERKDIS